MTEEKELLPQDHNIRLMELGTVTEGSIAKARELLRHVYDRLMWSQDIYFEDSKGNKLLTAIWTIGTWFHKEFGCFPRLFFNAMRGSGKTRKLKFIEALAWNGKLQTNLSEAVLFRTASHSTILIDEAEHLNTKEKGALRELLNAGYKRGNKVLRMRKSFSKEGEQQIVETFDLYGPCAIANISGLEDVLGDRAITCILEKSDNPSKVNLIEDFDTHPVFIDIKRTLRLCQCTLCSVLTKKNTVIGHWNTYLMGILSGSTLNTSNTYNTLSTFSTFNSLTNLTTQNDTDMTNNVLESWELDLFKKIQESGINGRALELFFPLFVIAQMLGDDVLLELINVAKHKVEEKKKDETIENKDIALIEFVSRKESSVVYHSITELTQEFKTFYIDDQENSFINSHWLGKALKRLQLVLDKRRVSKGYEVMLNVHKAKEKIKMFKTTEVKDGD